MIRGWPLSTMACMKCMLFKMNPVFYINVLPQLIDGPVTTYFLALMLLTSKGWV